MSTREQVLVLLRLPLKPHVRDWLNGIYLGYKLGLMPFPSEIKLIEKMHYRFLVKAA